MSGLLEAKVCAVEYHHYFYSSPLHHSGLWGLQSVTYLSESRKKQATFKRHFYICPHDNPHLP